MEKIMNFVCKIGEYWYLFKLVVSVETTFALLLYGLLARGSNRRPCSGQRCIMNRRRGAISPYLFASLKHFSLRTHKGYVTTTDQVTSLILSSWGTLHSHSCAPARLTVCRGCPSPPSRPLPSVGRCWADSSVRWPVQLLLRAAAHPLTRAAACWELLLSQSCWVLSADDRPSADPQRSEPWQCPPRPTDPRHGTRRGAHSAEQHSRVQIRAIM